MKLSVVIPIWNRRDLLERCLSSLASALAQVGDCELILIDDASEDDAGQLPFALPIPVKRLRNDRNRGFAHSANRGLREAQGEFLLLLNSDAEIDARALESLKAFLEENPERGAVAPALVGPDGRNQESCMALPSFWTPLFFGTPLERWRPESRELRRYFLRDLDHETASDDLQPPAACWLLRRALWQGVGEFDESLELFFNDVDWCRRLQARGGSVHYLPAARVLHHGGASTAGRADFVQRWQTDRLRYHRKHFGWLGGLFVKACVSWTYLDWRFLQGWRRITQASPEETRNVRRAFLSFLRA